MTERTPVSEKEEKVPRWMTSWPDWYSVVGNVAVVPASDYDALLRKAAPSAIVCNMGGGCAHSIKCQSQGHCEYPQPNAAPQAVSGTKVNQPAQAVAGLSDAEPVRERPSPAVAAPVRSHDKHSDADNVREMIADVLELLEIPADKWFTLYHCVAELKSKATPSTEQASIVQVLPLKPQPPTVTTATHGPLKEIDCSMMTEMARKSDPMHQSEGAAPRTDALREKHCKNGFYIYEEMADLARDLESDLADDRNDLAEAIANHSADLSATPSATQEYICKCGVRVVPHRCDTGEKF